MFLIALLIIQLAGSMELSSLIQMQKGTTKEENFDQLCYYELKQELIIKNYVEKIKDEVAKVLLEFKITEKDTVSFAIFWKIFRNGKYGKVATELSGSEDYVRSYWAYFTTKASMSTMTYVEFTRFMGLYYLEGELLVTESHPTLTEFFKNEHNISKRKGCNIALAYWALTTELLHRIFIEFKWSTVTKVITVSEIFTIITNTHAGKCHLMGDMKCKFFTEMIQKIMGFFNMSTGNRPTLAIPELKIAYSTMLFNDLFKPVCNNKSFTPEKIKTLMEKVGL